MTILIVLNNRLSVRLLISVILDSLVEVLGDTAEETHEPPIGGAALATFMANFVQFSCSNGPTPQDYPSNLATDQLSPWKLFRKVYKRKVALTVRKPCSRKKIYTVNGEIWYEIL
jgi:hypothetical protein